MPTQDSAMEVDVPSTFRSILKSEPDVATAIAAIKTLMEVLQKCSAFTLQELLEVLKRATEDMKTKVDCSAASVVSGCDLFVRFITLASETLEQSNFQNVRNCMIQRGKQFLVKLMDSRKKIAKSAAPFIQDGSKILIHSRSRAIEEALKEATDSNKRFQVFITESSSDASGEKMKNHLDALNIPSTVIRDSAVGYIMDQVDCVLVGAEGVVESGGIINKIGTYTLALCAKALNKPVYVLCESFKFVRLYPLSQADLPIEFRFTSSTIKQNDGNLDSEHPIVDYTPPNLLTLLFTDLGILTPSAVSDELIKLYL